MARRALIQVACDPTRKTRPWRVNLAPALAVLVRRKSRS